MLLIRIELFVQTIDMKKRQFFKAFLCLKVLFKAKIFNLLQTNFDAKKRKKWAQIDYNFDFKIY